MRPLLILCCDLGHSLASILRGRTRLGFDQTENFRQSLEETSVDHAACPAYPGCDPDAVCPAIACDRFLISGPIRQARAKA